MFQPFILLYIMFDKRVRTYTILPKLDPFSLYPEMSGIFKNEWNAEKQDLLLLI
jgi:hypothetical protein